MDENITLPKDVRWLCADGVYQEYVARMCALDPSLSKPDPHNARFFLQRNHARVTMLELLQDRTISREDFDSGASLLDHFQHRSPVAAGHHRIYLVEGLNPEFVGILGTEFKMDPSVFARHERTLLWNAWHHGVNDGWVLPSVQSPKESYLIKYFELRFFDAPLPYSSVVCAKTGRHIGLTRFGNDFEPVGIMRRKLSFWSRVEEDNGGWDVVLLCDPPVEELLLGNTPRKEKISNSPFQGGYVDFITHSKRIDPPLGPPRTSMLEDLCFYFKNYSTIVDNYDDPTSITMFPQKIIASHFTQLLQYIRAKLSNLEREMCHNQDLERFQIHWIENQWSNVQTLNRRCAEYREDAEAILQALRIPLSDPDPVGLHDWRSCEQDFQHIYRQISILKARLELLINSMTGLASIAGNRQALKEAKLSLEEAKRSVRETRRSVREAKSVKTLTLIGLVFIPLAYTSALFSMGEPYTPGADRFWVYFAVSLPLIVLVFLLTFLIQLGFDEDAVWSFQTFVSVVPSRIIARKNKEDDHTSADREKGASAQSSSSTTYQALEWADDSPLARARGGVDQERLVSAANGGTTFS